MSIVRRLQACFAVKENGIVTKIVAAGGYLFGRATSSSEILDVTTRQWKSLPSLPILLDHFRGVESVSGDYLGFTIGGYNRESKKNERRVYGLKKHEDNSFQWQDVNGMKKLRYGATVVNAPMSLVSSC